MLTAKQELFAQKVVEGMTLCEAYRSAYNTSRMSDKTVYEKSCILAKDDKIKARIQELRDRISMKSVMTAQERLEWLTSVMRNEEVSIRDRLSASDQMNRMQGQYVQKVEAEVKQTTINVELVD